MKVSKTFYNNILRTTPENATEGYSKHVKKPSIKNQGLRVFGGYLLDYFILTMKTLQSVETSGTPNITQRHILEALNTEFRFCVRTGGQIVRAFIE
jgi:hypothetical protein